MAGFPLGTLDGPDHYTAAWVLGYGPALPHPIERAAAAAMLDEEHDQP